MKKRKYTTPLCQVIGMTTSTFLFNTYSNDQGTIQYKEDKVNPELSD